MSLSFSRIVLPVPHLLQHKTGECLVACVGMSFAYIGKAFSYRQVTKLLNVREFGAYFSNIRRLETLGVSVLVNNGSMELLYPHLQQNHPLIVPVKTGELSFWRNHPLQF